MANKKILRLIRGMSRSQFEKGIGGNGAFETLGDPIIRANKTFATYKGPIQGLKGVQCICRHLASGKKVYGRTWGEIARLLAK